MKRHKHHTQHKKSTNNGFTLVEAIITFAIIAVLAKIAIPAYADYKERAKQNLAAQDIAMMSVKIKMYWDDKRTYPASLADVGMAGKLDPWQRPYIYLDLSAPSSVGPARKDRRLVPLNSDFDLYSKGKDGQSNPPISTRYSQDDILRANDGKFIDLAKNY
jgi:general secretion pathway protein G